MQESSAKTLYFFEGGGEMGKIMRSFNWADTVLGVPALWPAVLQQSVSLILNAALPMCILWGRGQASIFNDAYLPVLGNRSLPPHLLGRPASEIHPATCKKLPAFANDYLLAAGSHTQPEFSFYDTAPGSSAKWSLTFSAIKELNENAGVLIVGIKHQVPAFTNNEHNEALSFTLDANELGSWSLNVETNNFSCNSITKEIFGLPQNENVDLAIAINAIYQPDRERVVSAIKKTLANETPHGYNIDYIVVHPQNGKHKLVRAKGKLSCDTNGKVISLDGTLQDITNNRKLQDTQKKLEQLIEYGGNYVSISNLESGEITYLNQSGRELLNLGNKENGTIYNLKDFYTADQLIQHQAVILPALKEARSWSGRILVQNNQTGEQIPCFANYIVLPDTLAGEPISLGITIRDLRSELAAGKQLAESEKRFRSLVELAPVATAIYLGPEMKIQLANDAMINLWGKDASVIGKTVREALPELEGQPFHQLLQQVYSTGVMYQGKEDRADLIVNGELQTYYFNFSYKALRDVSNNVYGILNMAVDVTEQVKAKQQHEQSERNFRSLIMQAPTGICLLKGKELLVELVNDSYLEIVGKQRDLFEGKRLWEVLPEAKEQGYDLLLNQVLTTGEPYYGIEQPVELTRDGQTSTVYVNFVYEPLKTPEGYIEQVLVVATNVTRQVLSRLEVEDAEERAMLAIDSAKLGTFELNYLTGVMITSVRFDDIFGFDRPVTRNDYVSVLHPDDMEEYRQAHKVAEKTGQLQYKLRIIKAGNRVEWVSIQGQVYYDRNGTPVKLLGIARDVTRQKQDQQEREKFLSLASTLR